MAIQYLLAMADNRGFELLLSKPGVGAEVKLARVAMWKTHPSKSGKLHRKEYEGTAVTDHSHHGVGWICSTSVMETVA